MAVRVVGDEAWDWEASVGDEEMQRLPLHCRLVSSYPLYYVCVPE